MKFLLVDLINSLRRLRAARNFSQVSLLLLLALAADRRLSLCSLSSAMAGSLSHGAGGRVTFVNFNGACLSIHSLINELNISSFSSGSETPKEAVNGSVLKSSIKRRLIKVRQISDEFVPCLESGNFDVNSCVDGVMIAD